MTLLLAVFIVPAIARIIAQSWGTEQGFHGIIVLAGTAWLFCREMPHIRADRGRPVITYSLLGASLLFYLFGRQTDIQIVMWAGVCGALATLVHDMGGIAALRRLWVPLLLLFLVAPPPIGIVFPVSNLAIAIVARGAVMVLGTIGLDVAREGSMLYVNQYELHMAEACAGLSSLFSLAVMALLYIYLRHRADWRYALVLAALVVPIALLANLLRVVTLAVITVTLGDGWAQGVLHDTAGLILFSSALIALIALDAILWPLRRRLRTA